MLKAQKPYVNIAREFTKWPFGGYAEDMSEFLQGGELTGEKAEDMALHGSVLSTVKNGGLILTIDRAIFEMSMGL